MRRRVGLVSFFVSVFTALATASPASAAMCARWEHAPTGGTIGSPVPLAFGTYALVSVDPDHFRLRPWAVPEYPFRVQAHSPSGAAQTVEMAPRQDDEHVWVGSFTPDREGAWTFTIDNMKGSDPACYTDAIVAVEEGSGRVNSALTYAAIAFVILGTVAGFVALRRRRSRAGDRMSHRLAGALLE
jgi:hypothetical protein